MLDKINTELITVISAAISAGVVPLVAAYISAKVRTTGTKVETISKDLKSLKDTNAVDHKVLFSYMKESEPYMNGIIMKKDFSQAIEKKQNSYLTIVSHNAKLTAYVELVTYRHKQFVSEVMDIGFDNLTYDQLNAKYNAIVLSRDDISEIYNPSTEEESIIALYEILSVKTEEFLKKMKEIKDNEIVNSRISRCCEALLTIVDEIFALSIRKMLELK